VSRIYKILRRSEWVDAQAAGQFTGSEVDHADGFIHFSTVAQAAETARRYFASQPDLLVLEIEADGLGPDLKWEPSRGGDLFPHLYRTLELAEVLVVHDAPLDAQGQPRLENLR
jgi:uncharacterized protein (DUF952 family)